MSIPASRRSFLGSVGGLFAAIPAVAQGSGPRGAGSGPWNLSWLDGFKGRHKQVFDLGAFDLSVDTPLRQPMNYLNTIRDVYQAVPPDVNVAIGISRAAFPMNASDALWQKYKLGELWKITDRDGKPATRNIFLGEASGEPAPTIRSLMTRGTVFWQCNIALGAVASQLARDAGIPFEKMRDELIAGLVPGVKLVPAHSLVVGLVQERGFTYMRP